MTRSYLFVPGTKEDWIRSAITRPDADALILDLEDSVSTSSKQLARANVAEAATEFCGSPIELFVRVNSWGTGALLADASAVAVEGISGLFLSKADSADDVVALDRLLSELEVQRVLPLGTIEIVPILETARGLRVPYEIATASPRVHRIAAMSGPTSGGDINRALHRRWTLEGLESLYTDSRGVLHARAAGVEQVIAGPSTNIDDDDMLRSLMERSRQLGADGAMAIHPGQVSIINEIFSPSPEEVVQAVALLVCFAEAVGRGAAATKFHGQMIDYAHARVALALVERARTLGLSVGEVPEIAFPEIRT